MKQLRKPSLIIASVWGFFGVAFGAFGAHGLKSTVTPEMMAIWNTATLYLFVHVFAALIASKESPKIGLLFSLGSLIFSGSLYLMVLTNIKKLGMITPIGGVIYLVAWAALAYVFYRDNE